MRILAICGSLQAASGNLVLLRTAAEFVPAGLPWAHMDIAGPSWNSGGAHGYTPKGGTGYGLRTMLTMIEDAAQA